MSNLFNSDSHVDDNLIIVGQADIVTDDLTIAQGQTLLRGTILGLNTATGEAYAVDSSKTDGTQSPYAILCEDTDTTDGSTESTVYFAGEFYVGALFCGGTDTPILHKVSMRKLAMYQRNGIDRGIYNGN